MILFVLGLSFVLLTVAFRSLVIPAKAIVMNLLSVAAAYGLVVLVFQEGVGPEVFKDIAGWLGFGQVEAIEAGMPLFLFAVLFGLSMDYHVFLLSRIRERFDQTGDNTESVAYGLRTTGALITGAAAIMVAVFAGFAAGPLVALQQMGFGLAVAVALDATIVRSILVPATHEAARRPQLVPAVVARVASRGPHRRRGVTRRRPRAGRARAGAGPGRLTPGPSPSEGTPLRSPLGAVRAQFIRNCREAPASPQWEVGTEDRLDVEDRCAVDGLEVVHLDPQPVDLEDRHRVEADGIGTILGPSAEDALHRFALVIAGMDPEDVAARQVEPGDHDHLGADRQVAHRLTYRRVELEPGVGGALCSLHGGVRRVGQRRAHVADRPHFVGLAHSGSLAHAASNASRTSARRAIDARTSA